MLELGFTFYFNSHQLDFYLDRILYGHIFLLNGFFTLDLDNSSFSLMALKDDDGDVLNLLKWHVRLGHIGKDRMTRLTR